MASSTGEHKAGLVCASTTATTTQTARLGKNATGCITQRLSPTIPQRRLYDPTHQVPMHLSLGHRKSDQLATILYDTEVRPRRHAPFLLSSRYVLGPIPECLLPRRHRPSHGENPRHVRRGRMDSEARGKVDGSLPPSVEKVETELRVRVHAAFPHAHDQVRAPDGHRVDVRVARTRLQLEMAQEA